MVHRYKKNPARSDLYHLSIWSLNVTGDRGDHGCFPQSRLRNMLMKIPKP